MKFEDVMLVTEIPEYVGVSLASVRKWVQDGKFPTLMVGNRQFVKIADIDRWKEVYLTFKNGLEGDLK